MIKKIVAIFLFTACMAAGCAPGTLSQGTAPAPAQTLEPTPIEAAASAEPGTPNPSQAAPTGTRPALPSPTASFTTPHPILGDPRVRQALALCTDRGGLIRAVYPWLQDTSNLEMDTFIFPGHWAYPAGGQGLVLYPYDPVQGKALLEAAGWSLASGERWRVNSAGQPLALTLTTTTAEFRRAWTAALAEQWRACGVRLALDYREASWFFGEASGLARREFEIAAFSWMYFPGSDPGGRTLFACDQIPSPENGWQGQNYAGWCSPAADAGIRLATTAIEQPARVSGYHAVQAAYQQEVPAIPLFRRLELSAADPALENFVPNAGEVYTWNAWQWTTPGKDTLILGEASEPAGLGPAETAYVADVVRALVLGLDVARLDGGPLPITLKSLPTLEAGGSQLRRVEAHLGDAVIDASGKAAALEEQLVVLDADGQEVPYPGGALAMNQLVTTFEFVDGLAWSDGTPVSRADYELGYRLACSPEVRETEAFKFALPKPFLVCDAIEQVDFISDTTYRVTWKPGYHDPEYMLPPIQRQPAHQLLEGGRRLAQASPQEWVNLDEVRLVPLGIGPYIVEGWEFGREIRLRANPNYFQGQPATPSLVIRFVEQNQAASQLIAGDLDIVGWDSLNPAADGAPLSAAQTEGRARVFLLPGNIYEQITFALFTR